MSISKTNRHNFTSISQMPWLCVHAIVLWLLLMSEEHHPDKMSMSRGLVYCQAIDVQLGLAIDSPKATLAVRRRLACEMVKCWQQVVLVFHISAISEVVCS